MKNCQSKFFFPLKIPIRIYLSNNLFSDLKIKTQYVNLLDFLEKMQEEIVRREDAYYSQNYEIKLSDAHAEKIMLTLKHDNNKGNFVNS